MIKCKECWWFKPTRHQTLKEPTGQCLAYGFCIKENSEICCNFERGKRCK